MKMLMNTFIIKVLVSTLATRTVLEQTIGVEITEK